MLDSLVRVSRRVAAFADLLCRERPVAIATIALYKRRPYCLSNEEPGHRGSVPATTASSVSTLGLRSKSNSSYSQACRNAPAHTAETTASTRRLTALDRQPCNYTLRLGPQCCTSREAAFTTIQFHVLLTLSSKFFSNFHHCTCLLSVLGLYLALRGVYLALWAALTSYLTRRRGQQSQTTALRAYHPLWAVATVKLDFDWCLNALEDPS